MATKSSVTGSAATAGHAKPSGPESASEHACRPFSISKHHHHLAQRVCGCGHFLRGGAAVAVCYSFGATAWRVRRQPQDLAFVAAAASLLAALFACLRRAERLAPDSPNGERRRLQAAVWALSTALSCAFAYRVAAVMPAPMAVLVWCLTAFVALVGLYLLVLCRDQEQYQALPGDSDAKASAKISNPTDDLV